MPYSLGHDVLSDWKDKSTDDPVFGTWKNCGFMTHDESAILYRLALSARGDWCDVGCHTGWTSAHIHAGTGCEVTCVDYMLTVPEFEARFLENTNFQRHWEWPYKAEEFFGHFSASPGAREMRWTGFCIDADHDEPQPLLDATNALKFLANNGVIVFHDFWGRPIRQGVEYLISQGLECRIYDTPAGMAVCWQGDFEPVEHVPDPAIHWDQIRRSRAPEFDFSATT